MTDILLAAIVALLLWERVEHTPMLNEMRNRAARWLARKLNGVE